MLRGGSGGGIMRCSVSEKRGCGASVLGAFLSPQPEPQTVPCPSRASLAGGGRGERLVSPLSATSSNVQNELADALNDEAKKTIAGAMNGLPASSVLLEAPAAWIGARDWSGRTQMESSIFR